MQTTPSRRGLWRLLAASPLPFVAPLATAALVVEGVRAAGGEE